MAGDRAQFAIDFSKHLRRTDAHFDRLRRISDPHRRDLEPRPEPESAAVILLDHLELSPISLVE
jgi:hypothetical protein